MTGGIGTKEIRAKYPHATGITADAKHEGRQVNLVPTKNSLVSARSKVGI